MRPCEPTRARRCECCEQPIAATAKNNRSTGARFLAREEGSVLHALPTSTRLGEAVVRRKGAAGDDGHLVPDMSIGVPLKILAGYKETNCAQLENKADTNYHFIA